MYELYSTPALLVPARPALPRFQVLLLAALVLKPAPAAAWPVDIKMKVARFVMRSASSLIPREVEHFSRYSPSPLSMKQLLDFGEPGRRARAGALRLGQGHCLNFHSQCREG